jgi:hypothetical protein
VLRLISEGNSFRHPAFQNAVLLLLFQTARFLPLADPCIPSYRDLLHCILQQFNETLYGRPLFSAWLRVCC